MPTRRDLAWHHREDGSTSPTPVATRYNMIEALNAVDWARVLENHDGWSWVTDEEGLRCPAKALIPLVRIEQIKGRQGIRARFQADCGTCDSCSLRATCITSDDSAIVRMCVFRYRILMLSPFGRRG